MKGWVDDSLRALLRVAWSASRGRGAHGDQETMLVAGHRLDIHYEAKTVELT